MINKKSVHRHSSTSMLFIICFEHQTLCAHWQTYGADLLGSMEQKHILGCIFSSKACRPRMETMMKKKTHQLGEKLLYNSPPSFPQEL
ncbi:unnamed protein product [Cuscuta epithymum]|uniref:Uncharacterized protein n=1 Tax=Cuscuta epithymum TaxID=186058 RepID=A0AAV0FZW1_9ASTE|nr:unnamed protein product [Cuscuta epithymum]